MNAQQYTTGNAKYLVCFYFLKDFYILKCCRPGQVDALFLNLDFSFQPIGPIYLIYVSVLTSFFATFNFV